MTDKSNVFLVAFHLETREPISRQRASTILFGHLRINDREIPGVYNDEHAAVIPNFDLSWWIAEDDRDSNADEDSAVFVPLGTQATVSRILFNAGLTPVCNVIEKSRSLCHEIDDAWFEAYARLMAAVPSLDPPQRYSVETMMAGNDTMETDIVVYGVFGPDNEGLAGCVATALTSPEADEIARQFNAGER